MQYKHRIFKISYLERLQWKQLTEERRDARCVGEKWREQVEMDARDERKWMATMNMDTKIAMRN